MKYRTLDGKVLEARDQAALGQALWQGSFLPEPTLEDWMAASARRALVYNGSQIRTDSVEHHVQDLVAAGFLTLLEE